MNSIRNRFDQPGYTRYMQPELLLLKGTDEKTNDKEFALVTYFYGKDINAKKLRIQFQTLICNLPKDMTPSIRTITEFIKTKDILLYSEIAVFNELLLMMTATNATSEKNVQHTAPH